MPKLTLKLNKCGISENKLNYNHIVSRKEFISKLYDHLLKDLVEKNF